ncbi:MAG: hypothetical protein ACRD2P_07760, partial [Terriglobia bacterium]
MIHESETIDHTDAYTGAPINARLDTRMDARTVTEKRRAANQAAALKSTGPKTPEGKQRAAFNSFQHGAFAAEDYILREALGRSGYDAAEFDGRRQELLDDWQPGGAQQRLDYDGFLYVCQQARRKLGLRKPKRERKVPQLLSQSGLKRFFQVIEECGNVQHEIMLKLLFYTA